MAYLVFKDGTTFEGEAFGAWPTDETAVTEQEVVFNTSMSGYQEMVTDLSYAGQILVLTQPQIGNYGWHHEENEADKTRLQGLIVRELSQGEGSLHGEGSLEDYCQQYGVQGLKGSGYAGLDKVSAAIWYLARRTGSNSGGRAGVLGELPRDTMKERKKANTGFIGQRLRKLTKSQDRAL